MFFGADYEKNSAIKENFLDISKTRGKNQALSKISSRNNLDCVLQHSTRAL